MFATSLAVFGWGLTAASPWIDEAATWLAVHRSWSGLLALLGGADAPVVPYYALVKAASVAPPGFTALRLWSALAAAGTVTALACLLTRLAGYRVALAASALLVGMAGFDRYAQEARPYSLFTFVAALSWLGWDRWTRRRTPATAALFAGSVTVAVLTHPFGVFLLPAQLVAELALDSSRSGWEGTWWARARRLLPTALWGCLGVLLAAYHLGLAVANGTGGAFDAPVTPGRLWATAKVSVASDGGTDLTVGALCLLGVVGALTVTRPRWRHVVTVLLAWLTVPTLLAVAAAVIHPNLLRSRYLIGSLPPLAGLAAVGVVVLAEAAGRVVRRAAGASAQRLACAMVAVGLVGAALTLEWPDQLQVRAPAGHGEDARGALAAALAASRASAQPVVVSDQNGAMVVTALAPDLAGAGILFGPDPSRRGVWPVARPASEVEAALSGHRTVVWLYRALIPGTDVTSTAMDLVRDHVPPTLQRLHFTIRTARRPAPGWVLVVLARPARPA